VDTDVDEQFRCIDLRSLVWCVNCHRCTARCCTETQARLSETQARLAETQRRWPEKQGRLSEAQARVCRLERENLALKSENSAMRSENSAMKAQEARLDPPRLVVSRPCASPLQSALECDDPRLRLQRNGIQPHHFIAGNLKGDRCQRLTLTHFAC
jgi:hypothetical protein